MSDQMGIVTSHSINDVIDIVKQAGESTNSRASAVARFNSPLPLDSVLPRACAASMVSA
jgi:hypothetical protein